MDDKLKDDIESLVKSAMVGLSFAVTLSLIEGNKRSFKAYALIGAMVTGGFLFAQAPKGFLLKR